MDWIKDTQKAINYIEDNLTDEIGNESVARHLHLSSHHFQRVFSIITGLTISDYIRNRRLSLAGRELFDAKMKVIDAALKYGYESPESFAKAFARFHGVTPASARESKEHLKYYSPLTVEMTVKGGFEMLRKLIPNVADIYDDTNEHYMFCSCMSAVMATLNEDADFDFKFFAGVTGDLFTQTWRLLKWQYSYEYSMTCHDTQVPIRAAFDACGYAYDYVCETDIRKSKPLYLQKIVDSIDRGYPVLAFAIAGPPTCAIICGYEENGDVLIGRAQRTDEPGDYRLLEPYISEYFQVQGGLDRTQALIFFGKKKERPTVSESIRKSVLSIPQLASLPPTENACFGLRAFGAWADSLLDDADFKDDSMLDGPMLTYGSCMSMLEANMNKILYYLNNAEAHCPELKMLIRQLRGAYQETQKAMGSLMSFCGGRLFTDDRRVLHGKKLQKLLEETSAGKPCDRRMLLDREFRVALSAHIREIGQCYADAAKIICETAY